MTKSLKFILLLIPAAILCWAGSLTAQSAIVEGSTLLIGGNSIPTESSNDTLFYWNQDRMALRAGVFENGGANQLLLGLGSTAFGKNNQVGGTFATAFGTANLVQGTAAKVWGRNNQNYGQHGTVWGFSNQARDNQTTVFGTENDARQENATAWGKQNIVNAQMATAWGEGNEVKATNATITGINNISSSRSSLTIGEYSMPFDQLTDITYDSLDYLFTIGNGTQSQRSNALIVNRSGSLGLGTNLPQDKLHIQGGKIRLGDTTTISEANGVLITNSTLEPEHANQDLGSMNHKWGTIYAENGVIQTSDIRLKKNITLIGSVLPKLLLLRPINYELTTTHDDRVHNGLSAQEVATIFPSIVSKINSGQDANDTYGMNYTELIPILIKAIQEQQHMINKLHEEINKK